MEQENKIIYAIIETGNYEETHIEIYKLNKLDKDKFTEFCKISEDLQWEDQLRLILFCENIELIENKYLDYSIEIIDKLLAQIKDDYKWVIELDELEDNKDLIMSTYKKLLSYEFLKGGK